MFSASQVIRFVHTNKVLRWGQAFHQYMDLYKITNPEDKLFCDQLYNAPDDVARQMVSSRTDRTQ